MVTENYPQLKSDPNFRDLQAQLEGTENRITVARNRYIQAVQEYNVPVRPFPTNLTAMMFGYRVKPSFTVENEKAVSHAADSGFLCTQGSTREVNETVSGPDSLLALLLCGTAQAEVAVPRLRGASPI